MIVALTQSPDRLVEYAGHDGHARFVAEELPAQLARDFPLHPSASARGLMGASFGGVASLHAAYFGIVLVHNEYLNAISRGCRGG